MEKTFRFMRLSASYNTRSSASLRDAAKSVCAAFEEALVREIPHADGEGIVQMFDAYAHNKAPWYGVGLAMVNAALLGVDVLLYVQDENHNRFEFTDIAHVERIREQWGTDAHVTGMCLSVRYSVYDTDHLYCTPAHCGKAATVTATVVRGGEELFSTTGESMHDLADSLAGCMDEKEED